MTDQADKPATMRSSSENGLFKRRNETNEITFDRVYVRRKPLNET